MKVAIVGGTGNIGSLICRDALAAGHEVRILTRGGAKADELTALGAEAFIGSFDLATAGTDEFFEGVEAAFTMVRSDWSNPGHYPAVAARIAAALRRHTPELVVNLSAVGAELDNAGHNTAFKLVEAELNTVGVPRLVHLRGGWFAENFLGHVEGIASSGMLATASHPTVPLPVVALKDIARAATEELLGQSRASRGIRDVQGPADLSIADAAGVIARAIDRPVDVVHTPLDAPAVAAGFLVRFGDQHQLDHRIASNAAFTDGRARFTRPRSDFDLASTTFAEFVDEVFVPAYHAATRSTARRSDSWQAWLDDYARAGSRS